MAPRPSVTMTGRQSSTPFLGLPGRGAGSRSPDGGGGTSTAALARLVRPGRAGRANFLAANRHRATVFSNGRNHPRWGDTRSPALILGSETASSPWSAVRSTTSVGPKGTRVTASERPSSRHDRGAVALTPSMTSAACASRSTPSPRTLDHHRSSTRPSPRFAVSYADRIDRDHGARTEAPKADGFGLIQRTARRDIDSRVGHGVDA